MVVVRKEGYTEPFSRWKMKESITSAGVGHHSAYKISLSIHDELKKRHIKVATDDMLRTMVEDHLELIDPIARERYVVWSRFRHEKVPIILLIGGASGIGKSSVALEVAHRLGIRQVIGTDSIREIMKNMIAPNLMPSIHHSSYSAYNGMPFLPSNDRVVTGFCEQSRAVYTGVDAVVKRSLKEGISLVLEGVHIIPEFVKEHPNIVPVVVYLDDIEDHKSRFVSRATETHMKRDAQHYLGYIDSILGIQDYIKDSALRCDVPIIENTDFNTTVKAIINISTERIKKLL